MMKYMTTRGRENTVARDEAIRTNDAIYVHFDNFFALLF